MGKYEKCPKCGSDEIVVVITGGITVKVLRKGEFTIKDEITYEPTDKYSKWYCAKCKTEI